MDPGIPNAPNTTLAGVASLTDCKAALPAEYSIQKVVPELPLPTPAPQAISNKSLLFHPRVEEEAKNLLKTKDVKLIPQLVSSLEKTSAEHIEVKDSYSDRNFNKDGMPNLLKALLDANPQVFSGNTAFILQKHQRLLQQKQYQQQQLLKQQQTVHTQSGSSSQQLPDQHLEGQQPLPKQQLQGQQLPFEQLSSQHYPNQELPDQQLHSQNLPNQQSHEQNLPNQDLQGQHQFSDVPQNVLQQPEAQTQAIQPVLQDVEAKQETEQSQVPLLDEDPLNLQAQHQPQPNNFLLTSTIGQHLVSSTALPDQNLTLHTKPVATSVIQQSETSTQLSNSDILENKTEAVVQPNNNQKSIQAASVVTHTTTTSELRQLRRPSARGQQPAQTLTTSTTNNTPLNNAEDQSNLDLADRIKQPIIRIGRISEENQALMQKSLKQFVASKPQLAKELGIDLKQKANYKEDSDSENESRQDRKRKKVSDDEYEAGEDPMDTFSALMGKRRKMQEKGEEKPIVLSKPKLRKVERKFVPVLQKLSTEELMESNTYVRFNKSVEHVLRSADDMDFAEIVAEETIQDEYLLSRSVMHELCIEAAKLKTLGAMEMMPTERFTRLLHVLELNIRGGDRISPVSPDDDSESIREYWMESTMERVLGAADACLVCLYIMTSPNMHKRVYIEEVIDRIVLYIKYHLSNTIFPSYDSTYKLDNKKKDGRKKQKAVSQKGITQMYTKISESISLLAELMNIQVLTDTSVLHASSMGISPFFVENVSELQLASLKLVTTIFTKYESHRRLLLDDILASIARLPSTKRSLRTYRLNSEENIQMLTALVLQLIQCVVSLPEKLAGSIKNSKKNKNKEKTQETESTVDKDVLVCNKIEKATATAGTFLKVFLSKCGSKQEEIDYRPLFENFVQDLLATVNKPEWPATELLLSLLGKMLVQNFSNKSTEMSLRLASLDYLGVVAARLRRDSVLSRCKLNTIDQMIKDIKQEEIRTNDDSKEHKKKHYSVKTDDERTQFLQKMLLDFLGVNSQNDESYKNARHFYICQWYKNLVQEKAQIVSDAKKNLTNKTKQYSEKEEEGDSDQGKNPELQNQERFRIIEEKKKILLSRIVAFQESVSSGNRVQVFQTYIDYDSAELIVQFLSSKRYFSQSFDQYLRAILVVLKETSIAIRTKAMKCLTMIVEADPSVLGRPDMQMGVNQSILDSSTSVREAAVDLIGKFILRRPELIHKYYQILSPRILDTGVSVRKRVIKILKDICIECPEFPKVPEICVKMIRRINDEEGIKKLVTEVFQNMWFTPTKDDQALLRKVMHITDVVASSKEIGLEWFEQLLVSLYKPKEDKDDSTKVVTEPPKALVTACRQIVDCLIENILRLEETSTHVGASSRLVACVTTLLSFTKIRPRLLIKHASTLQPYLALKCHTDGDKRIVSNVATMLELVVPLLEHPSDTFLAQLEEDAMKLILQYDRPVVASCLACLGSIINKVTHNFKLIRDCFKKFNHWIIKIKNNLETCSLLSQQRDVNREKGFFKRALFVVGLLLRHFDFKNPDVLGDLPPDTKDQVYHNLMFFLYQEEEEIQVFTLKALGSICIRHYEFMLEPELKSFYHRQLTMKDAPLGMKMEVLVNIESYLVEEEKRMIQQDLEWKKRSKHENLKEMNDVSSGMASTVIQLYLKEIMQSYMHKSLQVRQPALRVIQLVYNQGLVHPVKTVPYLICMSTDPEKSISHSADKTLADIEKKYPGFIHTQAGFGIRLSYELQRIIQDDEIVRGSRVKEQGEYPAALNGYLYSLLRNSRQQRRALILKVMKHFDEQARTSLSYMLYLSDDLAYFPYQVQDEPLFIVHHIDLMISNSGTNLLQSFREGLISDSQNKILDAENGEVNNVVSALDEDDDEDALAARIPEDASHLQACLTAAQGCLLLLVLKQHIKDIYGLSDGKIQLYSPSEPAKVYEKAINRRSNALFNPKSTIAKIKEGQPPDYLDENGRRDLIRQYLDFKQLMLQLDPEENEDDENKANQLVNLNQTGTATILTEADQVILQNYKDHSSPKVPKLVISHSRFTTDVKRTPRTHRTSDKAKKVKHKKKRRKITSDSESDENDFSDPDWT